MILKQALYRGACFLCGINGITAGKNVLKIVGNNKAIKVSLAGAQGLVSMLLPIFTRRHSNSFFKSDIKIFGARVTTLAADTNYFFP